MKYPNENIRANLVGLVVDYLTRFVMGAPVEKAFEISLKGALNAKKVRQAKMIIKKIKGLDDDKIEIIKKIVTKFNDKYKAETGIAKDIFDIILHIMD